VPSQSHTARDWGCKHWPIQAQRERGHGLYNEPQRSFFTPEVPLVLKRLITFNNTEWVAPQNQGRGVCIGFIHVDWRLPERNTLSRTAVWRMLRTDISTSWLQGAVGSKADIKSQNSLFQGVLVDKEREVPANMLYIWFQFRSLYTILQSETGNFWFRVHLAAGSAAKEWWTKPRLMFQTLSLCMCCSSQMSLCIMLFASPRAWYPHCDRCSASNMKSMCPRNTQMMIPPFWFSAVGWS